MEVASNGDRIVVTAGGNVTVHFGRASVHTVNERTQNIGTVTLGRNSYMIKVDIIHRNNLILAISRANCNELSDPSSCHVRDHNNGNLAGCRARGCNSITTVGIIGLSSSVVVVSRRNVVVEVTTRSVHIYTHPSGNMAMVGMGNSSEIMAVTHIPRVSNRSSRSTRDRSGTRGNRPSRTIARRVSRGGRNRASSSARRGARRWLVGVEGLRFFG